MFKIIYWVKAIRVGWMGDMPNLMRSDATNLTLNRQISFHITHDTKASGEAPLPLGQQASFVAPSSRPQHPDQRVH
jgi:hypothetical protein